MGGGSNIPGSLRSQFGHFERTIFWKAIFWRVLRSIHWIIGKWVGPPSFSIAFLAQQKTHGQLIAANEISSIFMFVCIFSRNNPDVRFGANNIIIYIYWGEVESLGVTYENLLWFISKRIYLSLMSYPTDSGQRSTTHMCSAYINKMRIPHGPLEYYDD